MPKFQLGQKVRVRKTGIVFEVFSIEKIGNYYFYLIPGRKLVPESALMFEGWALANTPYLVPSFSDVCLKKVRIKELKKFISEQLREIENLSGLTYGECGVVLDPKKKYAYQSVRTGEIRLYEYEWAGNQSFIRTPDLDVV